MTHTNDPWREKAERLSRTVYDGSTALIEAWALALREAHVAGKLEGLDEVRSLQIPSYHRESYDYMEGVLALLRAVQSRIAEIRRDK